MRPGPQTPLPARRRRLCLAIGALALACVLERPCPARAGIPSPTAPAFPPDRTWVFVAGLLEFEDAESFDSFPQDNRQDAVLVDTFRQAGVPADHIVYLRDRRATLKRLQQELAALLRRIPEDGTLVFYYTGHGYEDDVDDSHDIVFAPWDASDETPGWSMRGVVEQVYAQLKGRRALLLADSCLSGAMVKATRQLARSYPDGPLVAAMSSSSAREGSTSDWTFTEAFIDALGCRSWGDLDADGRCTLDELAHFEADEMAAFQAQHVSFEIPDGWPGSATLATVSGPRGGRIGERVKAHDDGDWWDGRIIEEKPGRYRIRFVGYFRDDDRWLGAKALRPLDSRRQFTAGTLVDVRWKDQWWPARVVEEAGGSHRVELVDGGSDEWTPPERLRLHTPPSAPLSAIAPP